MSKTELKHLLIVTPGFPQDENDTACLPAVQQFVLCYQEQYPETKITILSLHYPFNKQAYKWHGIAVFCVNGKNKTGISRLHTVYKAIQWGKKINKAEQIDAVLSLWLTDGALAAKYIAKATKVLHLIWMHGQDARIGNKYIGYVNPMPAQLIAISSYQNNILQQAHGIAAKYIVNNGINEKIFPALNTGKRNIDLLAVGSLIPLKQYHLFILMIKQLVEEGFDKLNCVLVGDGIEKENLTRLVTTHGLEQHITIAGAKPHAEVLRLMNESKIFVHTSSYEGHSTVLLEALYAGCYALSLMPIADSEVTHFTLCSDMDEMKKACVVLLKKELMHQRVLHTSMADSAAQIHNIIVSMQK